MPEFQSKEELYAVLDKMVALLSADEAFAQRIARADVSVALIVSDLDAQYTLKLAKGTIEGHPGDDGSASVGVTLTANTLDRLMSAKLDGESAYDMGLIRLRGSEWVAQSVAGYVYTMARAYKKATGHA